MNDRINRLIWGRLHRRYVGRYHRSGILHSMAAAQYARCAELARSQYCGPPITIHTVSICKRADILSAFESAHALASFALARETFSDWLSGENIGIEIGLIVSSAKVRLEDRIERLFGGKENDE
jgi:hypothetical protein